MTNTEIELLQAKTEISDLKNLLFDIRMRLVIPDDILKRCFHARDFDYTTIHIVNKRHTKKSFYRGCNCYKCRIVRGE